MSDAARDLRRQLEHLETVIRELEDGPESPLRARMRELVRGVLELHASGLGRMLALVAEADAAGAALARAFARDPMIGGLLLLHGLHPDDLDTRVRGAVAALAPLLERHGARVERLAIEGGVVRIGLHRAPGRGRLSAEALRAHVEDAVLAAAPDATGLRIDVPDDRELAAFVPVEAVRLRRPGTDARP